MRINRLNYRWRVDAWNVRTGRWQTIAVCASRREAKRVHADYRQARIVDNVTGARCD